MRDVEEGERESLVRATGERRMMRTSGGDDADEGMAVIGVCALVFGDGRREGFGREGARVWLLHTNNR
jgi:hypothetical protein